MLSSIYTKKLLSTFISSNAPIVPILQLLQGEILDAEQAGDAPHEGGAAAQLQLMRLAVVIFEFSYLLISNQELCECSNDAEIKIASLQLNSCAISSLQSFMSRT